jgi:hypothetical protein
MHIRHKLGDYLQSRLISLMIRKECCRILKIILGFAYTGGQNNGSVVRGHFLICFVQVGFVEAWAADTCLKVIRN